MLLQSKNVRIKYSIMCAIKAMRPTGIVEVLSGLVGCFFHLFPVFSGVLPKEAPGIKKMLKISMEQALTCQGAAFLASGKPQVDKPGDILYDICTLLV